MQRVVKGIESLAPVVRDAGISRLFLVCGPSFDNLSIKFRILEMGVEIVRFSGFRPNPDYNDICRGVDAFKQSGCDGILAVGGGSAMDVAKCIKLFSSMNPAVCYLDQQSVCPGSSVPLIALPTTAGSGSEADFNAVIYRFGKKESVAHACLLPDVAVLVPMALSTLPPYQRRSTLMDALCQCIESWWSTKSTPESREFARKGIGLIMASWEAYIFDDDPVTYAFIQEAAFCSGKAIALTQTTAAHAMCYKITTDYGLAHGHAVALCLPRLWEWMLGHIEDCTDERGADYVSAVFQDIAVAMGAGSAAEAIVLFDGMMSRLGLQAPVLGPARREAVASLAAAAKVKNTPVRLDAGALESIYSEVFTD